MIQFSYLLMKLRFAKVRYYLKKKGNPIPENDIWIAALCLEHDVPLLSNDGHFNNIPELEVINWNKII